MRSAHRGVEGRRLGLDSSAQELQADVLAQQERAGSIDCWTRLSECVRFIVIRARREAWLDLRVRLRLKVGRQGHVQQARRGLSELLRDKQALRTSGLEGHAPIIVAVASAPNSAESR